MKAKKKILVLGATGMLGHKVIQVGLKKGLDVYGTVRGSYRSILNSAGIPSDRILSNLAIDHKDTKKTLERLAEIIWHDTLAVVNCIGITVQKIGPPEQAIMCNALFPHQLAEICSKKSVKLIHISTDCVFSGKRGNYTDCDIPDAEDLYGRTKIMGEVHGLEHLTIRSSMVGREIAEEKAGLLEWFLAQKGEVNGFTRVFWSGVTSNYFAEVIFELLEKYPEAKGLMQLASEPIDKYTLLKIFQKYYRKDDVKINKQDKTKSDKSMINNSLGLKFIVPHHEEMVRVMAAEASP